jgi:hypothetical protein
MTLEKTSTLFKAKAFQLAGSDGFQTSNKSSIQILKRCEEVLKRRGKGQFRTTVFCRCGK